MLDQFSEVLYFVKGVVRNKWIVTLVACLVSIGGWTYVYKMPDVYLSSARVHVDTRSMLRPLLRGLAIQSDVRGLIAILKKLMFARQNILNIAELAGIEIDLSSESATQEVVAELKSKIKISGGRGELFTISYESSLPHNAQNVVQAVLSVFSEQAQKSTLNDVDSAKRFIDKQIREYEQRLRLAESAKENFKRENIGLLPGQGGNGQVSIIQKIRKQMDDAKIQLSELYSRKRILDKQLAEAFASGKKWGLMVGGVALTVEDERIVQLKKRRNQLLLKYTSNHPNIVSIDSEVEALLERKAEQETVDGPSVAAMSSPFVQSIKQELNRIDVEVATINARVYAQKNKLITENEQFNERLSTETEMQNLNRDYDTIKKNYLTLIDRREQARLSSTIDSQVSALKFKIVDPAALPLKPSSPKRGVLYSAVLIIGYIIGAGIALLKIIVRPTFTDAKQIREVTGLPVLGTISEVVKDRHVKQNKLRLMFYIAINVLLLVAYSGVMFLGVSF